MPTTSPYTNDFFNNRKSPLSSAEVIVPLVLKLVHPRSIVDVGCGTGDFLCIFKKNGVKDILGIDGNWVDPKKLKIPEESFQSANLENPLNINKKFDLVVSLEVAEHLPDKSAESFIENLTDLGSIILFSAAVPLQGGRHHVNEQWPEYWKKIFNKKDYVLIDPFRKKLWDNAEVSYWYAQNIFLFVKKDILDNDIELLNAFEKTNKNIISKVHPALYMKKARGSKKYDNIINIIPSPIKKHLLKLKNSFFKKST